MDIALLAPAPFTTVSGGYAYDRRMVVLLREAGHAVTVIELGTDIEAAWQAVPAEARVVIDGLALLPLAPLAERIFARGAMALVHHPTALEPGLDAAEAARRRAIEAMLFPHLAGLIVTSAVTRDTLAGEFMVPAERIRVVVPGTDAAPRSRGGGSGPCRILSVGTVIPRKGHDVLLGALARLFDLDWRLTIVGSTTRDPDCAAALRALAAELAIADRVDWAGEADAATLDALWDTADLFALATHYEGYGMAVAEALRRGLPVAVCSGGAAAALLTPECGVACPPGDRDQLSKALRRLIFDLPLRARMAQAAWTVGQSLPDWPAQALLFAAAVAGDA